MQQSEPSFPHGIEEEFLLVDAETLDLVLQSSLIALP